MSGARVSGGGASQEVVVETVTRSGRQVMRVDCSKLAPEDFGPAADDVQRIVTAAPPRSLRVLLVLTGRVSHEGAEKLKRCMSGNGAYVHATAVVGSAFWNMVVLAARAGGRENVELFADETAALEWLAAQ